LRTEHVQRSDTRGRVEIESPRVEDKLSTTCGELRFFAYRIPPQMAWLSEEGLKETPCAERPRLALRAVAGLLGRGPPSSFATVVADSVIIGGCRRARNPGCCSPTGCRVIRRRRGVRCGGSCVGSV